MPAVGLATGASAYQEIRGAHESDDDFVLRSDGAAALGMRAGDDRRGGNGGRPTGNTAPENALHGQPHGQVYFVLHTYVAPGYELDVAALAREPAGRALGSDIRVRRNGIDPRTGDRFVEEMAFAIESQRPEASEVIARHVEALLARGVRRIFILGGLGGTGSARAATEPRADIDRTRDERRRAGRSSGKHARRPGPLREWVPAQNTWRTYGDDAVIVDASLCEPVPVRALLDAVEADRAVARALIDRRVDVIEDYGSKRFFAGKDEGYRSGSSEGFRAGKDEGYRSGKDEGYRAGKNDGYRAGTNDGYRSGTNDGMREAILLLLRARGLAVDEHAYARIAACNEIGILQRWLTRAVHVVSASALFDDA